MEERFDQMGIPWAVLACPYCLKPLERTKQGAYCTDCHTLFRNTENGQLDLRLRKNKTVKSSFTLSADFNADNNIFHLLQANPNNTFNFKVPNGVTQELVTYIPKAHSSHSLMLDIGCGDAQYKQSFTQAGYKYIGLDYNSQQSTLLGDAHALPFKDDCFELLFSRAVFEHLQYPFIAMNEAYRVLKPNCKFIGTVAFLEPFHERSFYHHTHLGLLNWLENAGFHTEHISPNPKWGILQAQAQMGLFPKMPHTLSQILVAPLQSLHKAWWRIGEKFDSDANETTRQLWTAGSFMFVATKPNKRIT